MMKEKIFDNIRILLLTIESEPCMINDVIKIKQNISSYNLENMAHESLPTTVNGLSTQK